MAFGINAGIHPVQSQHYPRRVSILPPDDEAETKYSAWIAENVEGDGYGQCKEITRQMADAFPELTRVRGHYYCWAWGERAHWWLTYAGDIIDPTSQQFPSKGHGEYVPWVGRITRANWHVPELRRYGLRRQHVPL